MPPSPIPLIAILAGGRSSRMGFDKAAALLDGTPMLTHIARTAAALTSHILIVGRTAVDFLPPDLPIEFLPDEHPTATGPAAGLLALLHHTHSPALVLGCDTPLLTPPTLQSLWNYHRSHPGAIATLATTEANGRTRAEPLFAVYTPAALPLLEKIHASATPLQSLLTAPGVVGFPLPPAMAAELFNVNDPAALAQAQAQAALRDRMRHS